MKDFTAAIHPANRRHVTTSLHPLDVADALHLPIWTTTPPGYPWQIHIARELTGALTHAVLAFTSDWLDAMTMSWCGLPLLDVFVLPRPAARLAYALLGGPDEVWPEDDVRGWADCFVRPRARVILVDDELETPQSLRWLMLHEATHVAVNAQGWLTYSMALRTHALGVEHAYDPESPEELLCNATATAALGDQYDRAWRHGRKALRAAFPQS